MLGITVDSFSEPELGARGVGRGVGLVKKVSYGQALPQRLIVHQLEAENLGLWLTRGEQPKHVTY